MQQAIALAKQNVGQGGGPFGAVVVQNGNVLAASANSVVQQNDPTCHAEMNAIRQAAKAKGNWDLSDCEIYSSAEPCPMCLGAIYWARIKHLYFAATRMEAHNVGFSDANIYDEMAKDIDKRFLPTTHMQMQEASEPFEEWSRQPTKVAY